MDEKIAVEIINVGKVFKLERQLKLKKNKKKLYFSALKGISFNVLKGETVGLIGLNGSGKSTLSNLISGIYQPTRGKIIVNGTVSLLSIGAGLKPNLSGVDNIYLKMLLMGFKKKEIQELIPSIIEFTELQEFITQPVKQYSSGMRARLGFGIAVQLKPDVLIIDEALAVGDQSFYHKCINKIEQLKIEGTTIIFVSHSISQIQELCDKVAWIHYGRLRMFNESSRVCIKYNEFINYFNSLSEIKKKRYQSKFINRQKLKRYHNNNSKVSKSILMVVLLLLLLLMSYSFIKMNHVEGNFFGLRLI